jgi:glycosyltransferase involved in cell wall biosynthesis
MEGMAAGLPVISTNISGIPELIEHFKTGLLVPPRDPVALADAIRTLCLDPDARARLGEAGRAKVLTDFNLHVSAQQLSQLFSRALEARPQSYTMAAD